MSKFTVLTNKTLLAALLVLLCSFSLFKANTHVTGRVFSEEKEPLSNVEIANTSNSFVTYSDNNGNFRIKAQKGDVLRIMLPGKSPKEHTVTGTGNIKIYFDDSKQIAADAAAERLEKSARKNRKHERAAAAKGSLVTVEGIITDVEYRLPIPGVNVAVEGKTEVEVSDVDGKYSINAVIGDKLTFSFPGMIVEKRAVTTYTLDVEMRDDGIELDEVVVEAYRSTTKEKSSVATATVNSVTIEERPAADVSKTLSGAVPGIAVSAGDGVPGSTSSIRIRGYASASEDDTKSGTAMANAANPRLAAGQLTAGEVNDFSKWAYWEGLAKDELSQWQRLWAMSPSYRYSVVLTNQDGYPLVNKIVHLTDEYSYTHWTARTDNTGRAELWYKPSDLSSTETPTGLRLTDDKKRVLVATPKEFHEGMNTAVYQEKCIGAGKVNIAFMVDATGSMGDEIEYLQAELDDVISRTKEALPEVELTMGSVFYRDHGDEYVVKNFDFDTEIPNVISFIQKQSAGGGGDTPEAVIEAYEAAIDNLTWDDDAQTRLLFVVLDAPPHHTPENVIKLQQLSRRAAAKGIRIIPIAASGMDKSTEYLMRAMALQTNGTYLFITNHSGIGDDHIEPSTDSYKVEMLNDLLLRIILQFTAVNDCNNKTQELAVNSKMESQIVAEDIKWSYYPNPASGPVTVNIDVEASSLMLFDTTGKLIFYSDKKAKQYRLDLSGLANGVYYITVITGDSSLYGKIIKKL